MAWNTFAPGGSYVTAASLAFADPCLAWAEAQGFVDQLRPGDPIPSLVPVVLELRAGQTPAALQGLLAGLPGNSQVRPHYLSLGTPYCSAMLSPAACVALAVGAHPIVRRFEFVMPMLPRRASPVLRTTAAGTAPTRQRQAAGQTHLLAVIDTGCAFAHPHLLVGGNTRLLGLWDQDPNPAFAGVGGAGVPADFGYGRELSRSTINALLAASQLPGGGSIDEEACYERAGYRELRPRATHGAFVTDLFAGPLRLGQRTMLQPDDPPRWRRDASLTPVSSSADLVFVQLPRDAWADPAGNALVACVLDGLRFVLDHAGPDTREIVANISCAIYSGSRNGSTILEAALASLVAEVAASGRSLHICMPGGNSYVSRWHARANVTTGGSTRVRLRVPTGSEAPTFVQVWAHAATPFVATVLAPGAAGGSSGALGAGAAASLMTPGSTVPLASVFHTSNRVRGAADPSQAGTLLWLALRPTEEPAPSLVAAPAGEWQIVLDATSATHFEVHVARSETDLGAPLRARPARLFDPTDDPDRYLRPDLRGLSAMGLAAGIDREGSLSGAAGGAGTLATTALTLRTPPAGPPAGPLPGPVGPGPSDYASAGPPMGPPIPHASAFCDESWALQGVRAAGSRGGGVVRLTGSSFASPQLARALADGQTLTPPAGPVNRWGSAGTVMP